MVHRQWFAGLALGWLGLQLGACGGGSSAGGDVRNLVLITADTLRADHLRTYGYHRDTAPNIDDLAKSSLVFDRCFSPIARTTPSHLSLMTGRYPFEHGVSSNFMQLPVAERSARAFDSEGGLSTFAESIRASIHTAAFVSAAPVKRITGLANGFETWKEPSKNRRPGRRTNKAMLEWLAEQEEPFFLWVHYMDAHGPYEEEGYPPKSYADLFDEDQALREYLEERSFAESFSGIHVENARPGPMTNLYDGSIRLLDEAVGELLAALREKGVWDESLIVFLSDHGQGLGQHGYSGHGEVWEEHLRVPLFVRGPGVPVGRNDQLMSIIDVLPTALSFAPEFPAGSFLQQSRGVNVLSTDFAERAVFGMGGKEEGSFSLTEGHWKYILRPEATDSLFDLSSDPFELDDLLEKESERAGRMKQRLLEEILSQKEAHARLSSGATQGTIDPKHLEELRALGYTGDEASTESD